MFRSFLIGLVAGQRGITPLAVIAAAVNRHRKRNPGLSEATTCNPLEDQGNEGSRLAPIGTPGYAKL